MNKFKSNKYFKLIILLLLICLWGFVIYRYSADNIKASKEASRHVVRILNSILNLDLSDRMLMSKIHKIVRKIAHISEYFILTVLIWHAMQTIIHKYSYYLSLCISLILAIFDEVHQIFSPGRTPCISDVGIDLIGVILALLITYVIVNYQTLKKTLPATIKKAIELIKLKIIAYKSLRK